MKKKYTFNVSVEGCKSFITALNSFKNDFYSLKDKYIEKCLEAIKNDSLLILKSDDTFFPSFTDVDFETGTNISVMDGKGVLSYFGEEMIYAEFGTGMVGEFTTNHPLANKGVKYKYQTGEKIDEFGRWTFMIPEKYQQGDSPEFITFSGYTGKRFVYDAFRDFVSSNEYASIFEELVSELFNKYF